MNSNKIWAENLASLYAPRYAPKVIAMKKLDRKAKQPATIFSYVFGTISILTLLTGMYLFNQSLEIGVLSMKLLNAGVQIAGVLGMTINYSLYKRIADTVKMKYAFEITELAKEVAGE